MLSNTSSVTRNNNTLCPRVLWNKLEFEILKENRHMKQCYIYSQCGYYDSRVLKLWEFPALNHWNNVYTPVPKLKRTRQFIQRQKQTFNCDLDTFPLLSTSRAVNACHIALRSSSLSPIFRGSVSRLLCGVALDVNCFLMRFYNRAVTWP